MDWAAIDFETANADRASACALGLVVVKEAMIVKRRSWLIRPSKVCFDLNNVHRCEVMLHLTVTGFYQAPATRHTRGRTLRGIIAHTYAAPPRGTAWSL